MVYTERAETASVSCGTSHVSAVSTPLRWIFKNELESHASALNLLESGEWLYIKAIIVIIIIINNNTRTRANIGRRGVRKEVVTDS